ADCWVGTLLGQYADLTVALREAAMRRRCRTSVSSALVLVAALALGACGGGDEDEPSTDAAETSNPEAESPKTPSDGDSPTDEADAPPAVGPAVGKELRVPWGISFLA